MQKVHALNVRRQDWVLGMVVEEQTLVARLVQYAALAVSDL